MKWLVVILVVALFALAWWLVFRGVRKYPNIHNHADDQPDARI